MGVGDAVDRAIESIFPAWAFRRKAYRNGIQKLTIDAGKVGRRSDGWPYGGGASANAELLRAHPHAMRRARDAFYNFPEATAIVSSFVDHCTGTDGVTASWGSDRLQGIWDTWAGDPDLCDAEGRQNVQGIWSLVCKTIFISGACIVRREWADDPRGMAVPIRLRTLEPDYLDSQKDIADTGKGTYITGGVEMNRRGRPVAYWLFEQHPGDNTRFHSAKSVRVPAEDIIYAFEIDRPEQAIGITRLHSSLMLLRDLDDYFVNEIIAKRSQSAPAAIVSSAKGAGMLGLEIAPGGNTDAGAPRPEQFEAGMIHYLPDAVDVHMPTVQHSANFSPFTQTFQRRIARGAKSTYQHATGDLSQANYSSNRMGNIGFAAGIRTFQLQTLEPQVCNPVAMWWLEAARGRNNSLSRTAKPTWGWPTVPDGDPLKETMARILACRAGFTSISDVQRAISSAPDSVWDEIEKTLAMMDARGIVSDADPRKTNRSGTAQSSADATSDTPEDIPQDDGEEDQ